MKSRFLSIFLIILIASIFFITDYLLYKTELDKKYTEDLILKEKIFKLINDQNDIIIKSDPETTLTKLQIIKNILKKEGPYSNDSNDLGGETVYGVTRKYSGDSEIWPIVDRYKEKFSGNELADAISKDVTIVTVVTLIYSHLWNDYNLNKYPIEFSHCLFDMMIHLGKQPSIKMLQKTLNSLNYNDKFGEDLPITGNFGNMTKARINQIFKDSKNIKIVIRLLFAQKYCHYLDLVNNKKSQRKFIRGWMTR